MKNVAIEPFCARMASEFGKLQINKIFPFSIWVLKTPNFKTVEKVTKS
jgi:hypothetical protein